MRPSVFLDTNVLVSGIFFEGNESRVLDIVEIDLLTCEDAIDELHVVIHRKLKSLKGRTLEIALKETERALSDIAVLPRARYAHKLKDARGLLRHKKDAHILAAVLYAKPDFFLTGDSHFFIESVQSKVRVMAARDFLLDMG